MLDDLLSGFMGGLIAKGVSKAFPPRGAHEFVHVPFEVIRQRNKWLYRSAGGAFLFGFLGPLFALAVGSANAPWRNEWLTGVIFGLPSLTFYVFLGLIWTFRGRSRTREFLFYAERQLETNIHVCHAIGVPMSVLGLVSLALLWR